MHSPPVSAAGWDGGIDGAAPREPVWLTRLFFGVPISLSLRDRSGNFSGTLAHPMMDRDQMHALFGLQRNPPQFTQLDQERSITQQEYKSELKEYQLRMLTLQRALMESRHSLVVVVEGPDAAGKGGAIKRLVEKLDPRTFRVYSIIKPSAEEYRHHYMGRFWSKLPAYGEIGIFDRSWYGRVMVERVEGFAKEAEWQRAFREINEFERQLVDDQTVLVKVYLMINKEEQLIRFKKREADPYKHWKISDEDWRNRKKWDQHVEAAQQMFNLTSTKAAPWHLIPGNYKWFARLEVLRTVVRRLEALGLPDA